VAPRMTADADITAITEATAIIRMYLTSIV
jgi:hypothetical protein